MPRDASRRPRAPVANAIGTILPARVRRLSNAEIEQTVSAVAGTFEAVAAKLPPDVRQEGYTRNADQSTSSAWLARLNAIAGNVAHRTVTERLDRLAPCARTQGLGCSGVWIDAIARRAWRRPLEPAERELLRATFENGTREGGGFAGGAEAILRTLLVSPSLLYLTEIGPPGASGARVTLAPYEVASSLSYTIRGAPPDDALLDAAASGELLDADAREKHARRLLAQSATRDHFRRFVLEWLEVDDLASTSKDAALYPNYEEQKPSMLGETRAFVDEVMVFGGGSLAALLNARFASVDETMARFYGLGAWGPRASLSGTRRAGVLQQASFLAAHAHEDGTSPIRRGDFVLRKLLCIRLPRPAEVGIDTVSPPPSKAQTTRARFASHVADPACASCHDAIDPLGFSFEQFDAVGQTRATDNGQPVDTSAHTTLDGRALSFRDSRELTEWLAHSPQAADCYLRQAFRYFTAQADPRVEATLVALARDVAPKDHGNLFEALIAFVRSDAFIQREARP